MNNDKYEMHEEDLTELDNFQDIDENQVPGARSRGRPRIPDQWSKVISIDNDNLLNIKVYLISSDLLLAEGYGENEQADPNWAPIFLHKHWLKENLNPKPEDFKLDDDILVERGQQISEQMKIFRERADDIIRDQININSSHLPRNQDRKQNDQEIQSQLVPLKTRKELANCNFDTWRRSQLNMSGFLAIEAEKEVQKTAKQVRNRGNPVQKHRFCDQYQFDESIHPGKRRVTNK